MARQNTATIKEVDYDDVASALAKAVHDGDIVNFRLIFMPFSPARQGSSESFDMPKYAYLLPDEEQENNAEFKRYHEMIMQPAMKAFVLNELTANRPAQLPSDLLLLLADNAVRQGKYTGAAQAYEMLRIRARIQQEFLAQADAALDAGDIAKGVRGYIIAIGLAYDYAAFPEPLPMIPDYQTRALMLHAEYPSRMEDCIGLWDIKPLLQAALSYLLLDAEIAARLNSRSDDMRLAFLVEWIRNRDPQWNEFVERLHQAGGLVQEFAARFQEQQTKTTDLAQEILQQMGRNPHEISAALLGRVIAPGEWWQYLKELAGEHPAAALFVARQVVGNQEILMPRYAMDSPLAKALGM